MSIDFNNLCDKDYKEMTELFESIQKQGLDLFKEKNVRYEASFFKNCAEDNDLSSAVIRLKDKVNRLSALIKNPELDNTSDESIKDTLTDLANYAVMCRVFLDIKR